MADAYSFDADQAAMRTSYQAVFDAYLRIFGRLSPRRGAGRSILGRDRRRRQPRVHGPVPGRRGPFRLLPGVWVRGQRGSRDEGDEGVARRPSGGCGRRGADGRAPHPRPSRHRRGRGLLRGPGGNGCRPAQVDGGRRRRGAPRGGARARRPRGAVALGLAALRRRGLRRPSELWCVATSGRPVSRPRGSGWWPTSRSGVRGPGSPGRTVSTTT